MLPTLRDVLKKKLSEEAAKFDKVIGRFKTQSITKIRELFYSGVVIVTKGWQ